jgi:hypothetical protein
MKSDDNLDFFFLGDTYFGEWHMRLRARKGQYNVLAEKGYTSFGEKFARMLCDGDQVIANLECCITDIEPSPLRNTAKKHLYSARAEGTINALKALNIDTVMLANNHSVDYGKAGLIDTLNILDRHNIKYIGAGRNEEEASKPFILKKQIGTQIFSAAIVSTYEFSKTSDEYGFYAKNNIPGVNRQSLKNVSEQVSSLKNENENMIYILSPHWGPNYVWRTFRQQNQAEELISAGVDLIVGHSAHMMQEIEYFRGKLILYSIGNFLMNGNGEYKRRNLPPYSFIARLNIQNINNSLVQKMLLYPIISDNIMTDFKPRFVEEQEFNQVRAILTSHSFNMLENTKFFDFGQDTYGYYVSMPIRQDENSLII